MKKTMVRVVAALLVAMLALTLLPMGAFAADESVGLYKFYTDDATLKYENGNPVNGTQFGYTDIKVGASGATIKTSDYDKYYITGDGKIYDIEQFYLTSKDATTGKYLTSGVGNSLTISGIPADSSSQDYLDWNSKYWYIDLGYVAHNHALSRWYSDGTTHWRECLACKKYLGHYNQFLYQNWCQDGDEDGICNVCGGDVPYHDITVIEEEGGKITVNRDNACHRMKITADVEPAEGYKLKKLHFTKIRDDGSEQEITRYKKNGQFWTYMPTYELEVSAEFVKTKK